MNPAFIKPATNTSSEAIETIREELDLFDDWVQRYRYLIDLGKKLPDFPLEWQQDQYRVLGCQSRVWLNYHFQEGCLFFAGNSDAAIVRGLIFLILRIYSGRSIKEILNIDPRFVKDLGLSGALSANRSNGIASMIQYMQTIATKYKFNTNKL